METSDKYRQVDVPSLLSSLNVITSSVMRAAEADTVGEVLERIAEAARDLVKARYAALGIPDGKGGLEYFMFSGLEPAVAAAIPHLPQGRGLLGAIMSERAPIRLDQIEGDPRSSGFPVNHPEMNRFLGVPIIVGDSLFGMLYLTDPVDGQPFSEQDQWLVETIAGYAALAIAGARLREQRHQLTLLEERERIGMELHDGVIQSLYAIGMRLQLMRASRKTNPDDLLPVMQSLNLIIEDIRHYINNLKTKSFEKKTITECLEQMVARLHIPREIRIDIDAPDGDIPFVPSTYEALCQMANEALSNIVRHADATEVQLYARQFNSLFELEIRDNGRGFNLQKTASQPGLGLRNIQQRARLHGGTVRIESEPGKGTLIVLSLPINR